MRNIIAHQYGKIDDEIIFDSIKEEIAKDAGLFIEAIKPAEQLGARWVLEKKGMC